MIETSWFDARTFGGIATISARIIWAHGRDDRTLRKKSTIFSGLPSENSWATNQMDTTQGQADFNAVREL